MLNWAGAIPICVLLHLTEAPMSDRPPLRFPPRRTDPVALIWIGGVMLAAMAYAVGPEHVVASALAAIEEAGWALSDLVHNVTFAAVNVMRAAAIGLLGVFIALSLLAIQRTGRGHGGLVVLTVAFIMLVWGAWGDGPVSNTRWLMALVLAALGAVAVTSRLSHSGSGNWRMPGSPPR